MSSMRRLAAPILALALLLGAAGTAQATPIAFGTWYVFCFGGAGTLAGGTGSCGVGPNSSPVGAPPWMITTTGPAVVRITDLYLSGDKFTLRDFGADLMTTSTVGSHSGCSGDPDLCYGDPAMSWGSVAIGAGSHSFDIFIDASPHGSGAAAFRVDHAGPGVVPEPSTIVLVASGLLGVFGVARRRRQ